MNNKQKLSSELLDDFNMNIEKFEENLTDEEIIEVRQYMLAWMLEMFGGWKKTLDCILTMCKLVPIQVLILKLTSIIIKYKVKNFPTLFFFV